MSDGTIDYEGENAAPRPVSQTIRNYLRRSISLSDILARLIRSWPFALVGAVLGILIGIITVWTTPPSYTVTLTLLPLEAGSADFTGGGGVGLDILTGLLGSSGPVPKFTRFVASFNSTGLAAAMDRKYDSVCIELGCDPKTRRWPASSGLYGWVNRSIASIAHLPDPDAPKTAVDLAKYIETNVVPTSDKAKMLVLSMNTSDAKKTSRFLVQLWQAANDYIKDQDNEIVKKEVAYVTLQLKTNTDLSQRDALTKMLADQEQHLMLTAVDLPYVASIQDGPTVEASNSAIRYLTVFTLFGFLIGGGLGVLLSFVPDHKRFWRSSWKRS